MNKLIFKTLIVCSLMIFSTGNLSAQRPEHNPPVTVNTPGSNNNNPNAHPPHGDAPFDLGLGVLLAAGIACGVKRKYDKKKGIQASL